MVRNCLALALLLVIALPGMASAVSGDPGPNDPTWCDPKTPVYSIPTKLDRLKNGALVFSVCALADPVLHKCNGPGCVTCPEWPAVQSITLNAWCLKLDQLPAPPVTGPGQPTKFDGIGFCKSICTP